MADFGRLLNRERSPSYPITVRMYVGIQSAVQDKALERYLNLFAAAIILISLALGARKN